MPMVEAPILWLFDTVLPRGQAGSSLRDIEENSHVRAETLEQCEVPVLVREEMLNQRNDSLLKLYSSGRKLPGPRRVQRKGLSIKSPSLSLRHPR